VHRECLPPVRQGRRRLQREYLQLGLPHPAQRLAQQSVRPRARLRQSSREFGDNEFRPVIF
jgi:hypothetical protein